MYIRKISRKNKDGSTVTYVQLAHNERDPQKGFAMAKVLYNFGRIEELDVEQLKRLVKSIARFLRPEEVLEAKASLKFPKGNLKWKSCRQFGGIYLVASLWAKFHFGQLLSKRIHDKPYQTPIIQAIFAMVANRCLSPSSKLSITDWVKNTVYIPDLPTIEVQVLYRAMDFLLQYQTELEQEIYWSAVDLLNQEVDILFFDTTSSYFETEQTTDLKQRGYSKDKRRDLPQVVIGLAVTRQGIPVKHWVFPGNTADMATIERVKQDLLGWRLGRCIIVHDAGMTSETNLQYLQRGGGHYIVGRKLKSSEVEANAALSYNGPYTEIKQNLLAKEIILGNGEKRKRLVLVKNIAEEQRAQTVRQSLIAAIESKLEHANRNHSSAHTKEICELKSHAVYSRYIKELKNGQLKLNKSRIAADRRFDGKFLIETSDDTLSLTDVVLGYKQLHDVEQAFRSLKTTLVLRPNYHSRDDRIRCHIFLCFLALLLARTVELKTNLSWSKIREEMNRIYIGEFRHHGKTISLMTELTKKQQAILAALDIKEPSPVVGIQLE